MAWPDGGDNPDVESVGATARTHADIATWEAATDVDLRAGTGTDTSPVGECYDDADFSENVSINGATSDSTHYRTLTVHTDERHDGTAWGGGAEIVTGSNGAPAVGSAEKFSVLEWFIMSGAFSQVPTSSFAPADGRHMFRNLVLIGTGSIGFYADGADSLSEVHIWNSVIHGPADYGMRSTTGTGEVFAKNCSVLGPGIGIRLFICTNVIVVGTGSTDFNLCAGDYNIDEDGTAPGGNSISSIAPGDIYANVGGGTEDLHLTSVATAANAAGDNLTAEFTDDIDGDTRPNAAFDIGADDFQAGAIAVARAKVARNLAHGSFLVNGRT